MVRAPKLYLENTRNRLSGWSKECVGTPKTDKVPFEIGCFWAFVNVCHQFDQSYLQRDSECILHTYIQVVHKTLVVKAYLCQKIAEQVRFKKLDDTPKTVDHSPWLTFFLKYHVILGIANICELDLEIFWDFPISQVVIVSIRGDNAGNIGRLITLLSLGLCRVVVYHQKPENNLSYWSFCYQHRTWDHLGPHGDHLGTTWGPLGASSGVCPGHRLGHVWGIIWGIVWGIFGAV